VISFDRREDQLVLRGINFSDTFTLGLNNPH
jgi:hypothetical protein